MVILSVSSSARGTHAPRGVEPAHHAPTIHLPRQPEARPAPWPTQQLGGDPDLRLTFNGYERIGERLTELANRHLEAGTVPRDITEMRGCLFFEQRRWHAQDDNPDAATMRHVWALIEGIRAALEQMPVKW